MFCFCFLFDQGAPSSPATNIVGREESKEIGAPFTFQTEAIVVAVMVIIIVFIVGYLLAPVFGVYTDLFEGLFVAVLSIINRLIQAPGGDIKCRFGDVVKAPATGATVHRVNGFFWSVLTVTTAARITTVERIDNILTGALIPNATGIGIDTPHTIFKQINKNKMIIDILKNETCVLGILLAAGFVSLFSAAFGTSRTNIGGGFLVTHRMLNVSKRRGDILCGIAALVYFCLYTNKHYI